MATRPHRPQAAAPPLATPWPDPPRTGPHARLKQASRRSSASALTSAWRNVLAQQRYLAGTERSARSTWCRCGAQDIAAVSVRAAATHGAHRRRALARVPLRHPSVLRFSDITTLHARARAGLSRSTADGAWTCAPRRLRRSLVARDAHGGRPGFTLKPAAPRCSCAAAHGAPGRRMPLARGRRARHARGDRHPRRAAGVRTRRTGYRIDRMLTQLRRAKARRVRGSCSGFSECQPDAGDGYALVDVLRDRLGDSGCGRVALPDRPHPAANVTLPSGAATLDAGRGRLTIEESPTRR